jgi:hypothetical protein
VILAMWNMTYLGTNALPCVSVLAQCCGHTNTLVRTAARASLSVYAETDRMLVRGISWTNAIPEPALRTAALRAAADYATNMQEFAFELLTRGTNDPDPGVRSEAVRLVARVAEVSRKDGASGAPE